MPEHYVIKHVTETSIVTIKINTMIDLNKSIAVLFIIYEIVGYAMQCWFVPIDIIQR